MSTCTGWIGTEFGADIHDPQMMNPNDLGNPSSATMRFTFVVLREISQQLLDGLP